MAPPCRAEPTGAAEGAADGVDDAAVAEAAVGDANGGTTANAGSVKGEPLFDALPGRIACGCSGGF